MVCWFEDRLARRTLSLKDRLARIAVHRRSDLPAAWREIAAAQRSGHWVALLLDYELGEWLDEGVTGNRGDRGTRGDGTSEGSRTPGGSQTPGGNEFPGESGPLGGRGTSGTDRPDPRARLTALVYAQAESMRPGTLQPAAGFRDAGLVAHYFSTRPAQPSIARTRYLRDLAEIREGIAQGAYYQVNYTFPLVFDWPAALAPEAAFSFLLDRHPVAHAACVQDEDRWVLSLSPELFVARAGDDLVMRPMKGTAPRHADPVRDQAAAADLQTSAKDRAENLMIVDLLRNDLGRIAVPGSVQVPALFSLEAYPSVWTLTSTVTARAPAVTLAETMKALFPCGSVTGAPKIAAMRAIDRLEGRRRGIYCGSVGWLAPNGDFSLNVAIRTVELRAGAAQMGVGGGIVYDSDPDREWEECWWKARVLNLS